MWTITIDGNAAHVPGTTTVLISPKLTKSLNAADKLEFGIPTSHPLYSAVVDGVFSLRYTVERDGAVVSRGRVLSRTVSPFDATASVVCEGELAYLADAVMPEYDFAGPPRLLLSRFLEAYNSQCEDAFALGEVTAYDTNDYIVRGNEAPSNLLSELLSKTVKSSTGGYLTVRHEGGVRYLDWLEDLGITGPQEIAKGSNLLDISDSLDGAAIITAIMPKGKKDGAAYVELPEGSDGQISGDVYRRGGYIYSQPLLERYGWHCEVVRWDDVTVPANLLAKATAHVAALAANADYDVSAVDLTDAGYEVDHLDLGQKVRVICDGITDDVLVTGCEWDMDDPTSSRFTFGHEATVTAAVTSASESGESGAGWSTDVTNYITHEDIEGPLYTAHRTTMWGVPQPDMDEGSDPPTYDGYPAAYVRVQQGQSGQWPGERGNQITMRAHDYTVTNDGGTIGVDSGDIRLAVNRHVDGDNLALTFGDPSSPTHRVTFDEDGLNIYGSAYYNGVELNTGSGSGGITPDTPIVRIVNVSYTTASIAVNNGVSGNMSIASYVPTGFRAIGIVGTQSTHGQNWYDNSYVRVDIQTLYYNIKHAFGSAAETCTVTWKVLCILTGMYG